MEPNETPMGPEELRPEPQKPKKKVLPYVVCCLATAVVVFALTFAGMTLLQKILYLADYMEPNRDFPGVERLRALAEHDLDEAVLLGLEMSLDLLTETGQPIDVNSRAARDFLKSERTKSE